MPEQNYCWFAQTVVDVRLEHGLTIDRREADSTDRMLAGCTSTSISCNVTRPPAANHPRVGDTRIAPPCGQRAGRAA